MAKLFIQKAENYQAPGFDLCTLLRRKPIKGDVGLEIECEGNKFNKLELPKAWTYHKDGSLRGKDNAEYVLAKPILFEEVKPEITNLWDMMDKYGTVLDDSNRTSVHVHLNVQTWHLNRLAAFAALYFSVEELLTAWCGEHRVGNLFCLRTKDAPAIVTKLKRFIRSDGRSELTEGLHYSGFNVNALNKFGSIEIRTLRGVNRPDIILAWVSMLERLYRLSAEYPDPRLVVEGFSGDGPMGYLQRIMGENLSVLMEGISYDNQSVMESMYDGIRLAQDLCYCRDWSLYKPLVVTRDPFKRDMDTVASQMEQYLAQSPPVGFASEYESDPEDDDMPYHSDDEDED